MRPRLLALVAIVPALVSASARADDADQENPYSATLPALPPLYPLPPLPPLAPLAPLPPLDSIAHARAPAPTPSPARAPAPAADDDDPYGADDSRVSIPAGIVTLGQSDQFHRHVDAYAIDKSPVTAADYRRCVDAGKCTPSSCMPPGAAARATCVDAAQADAYCAFAGARLPSEDEWENAARHARDLGLASMNDGVAEWTSSPYCFFCDRDDRVVRGVRPNVPSLRGWRAPGTRDARIGFRCAK